MTAFDDDPASVSAPPAGDLVLRLLDANANRAREGLRVLEDYARFVLDDDVLCGDLKQLRHQLSAATEPFLAEAILHRDTPGDAGTRLQARDARRRESLGDVVIAAGKRLAEALRAMEEFAKLSYADAAGKIEKIRYRFYDLEQAIARTLRPAGRFSGVRLYVLITESTCRRPWLETAEQAIRGGADCLQLREKNLEGRELLKRAAAIVALCRRHGVLSIINDRPDIALLSGADGVHVGQEDLPAAEVRKLLGASRIVGVSTHRLEQAKQAVRDGADYIGVGPTFRSETKARDFVAGCEYARQAATEIAIPSVAIAGINAENVDQVLACGIRAVAITAAIANCDDVAGAAASFKAKLLAANPVFKAPPRAAHEVSGGRLQREEAPPEPRTK